MKTIFMSVVTTFSLLESYETYETNSYYVVWAMSSKYYVWSYSTKLGTPHFQLLNYASDKQLITGHACNIASNQSAH